MAFSLEHSGIKAFGADVEVEDNGPGIALTDRTLIFDKFSRGEIGGAAQPGAGLGLAIAREIIARMNGNLELMPSRGRGACFRVSLPLLARAPVKRARKQPAH